MPSSILPSGDDNILNVKEKSLYARLRRLFSTDVIVRNIGGKQLKIKDTDNVMYATDRNSMRDRFNRIRSTSYNAYSRDFSLSYQAARMDLFRDYDCVGPDTIIPLPDGTYPTIAELTEKYKNSPQERFHVFSYDHETDSIKLGKAFHPRKKKGTRIGYKVTFDNGQYVIGSLKHPFLMRNGEYKMTCELRVGDSVMPFYEKDFYGHGYRHVYNYKHGWQSEHRLIAEQFNGPLNAHEVVHHKDFNKSNNSPDNLQIMLDSDHKQYHCKIIADKLWSAENKPKTLEKIRNSDGYKNRKFHKWNGKRTGENNPFFEKTHSVESNKKRSDTLKKVLVNRDQSGKKNLKYRNNISFDNVKEKAFEYYKEYSKINLWDFIEHINCDHSTLQNRLKKEGHDWKSFKQNVESTLNHTIVSIESVGEIEVYDVTVEKYHNFATDSCIVGNTMDMDPILASALDIYSDECLTYNEMGQILTVHSSNNNVKQILDNLFGDILNIQHNLWSWTRNMCKYGDFFLKLYIAPEYGIYMVDPISAYNVERIENSDPYNKRYVKFQLRQTDTAQAEVCENYEMAHFRLMSDSNFLPYGKCLASNSYVETEFGSKRINELEIGEKVWSFDIDSKTFMLTSILNKCNSGVKNTLKISSQHNEIECSEEHPVLVYCDEKLEYKHANSLKISDLLVISSNKNIKTNVVKLNHNFVTEHNHNGWKNNINILPTDVNGEFARFFGFMLGDGWLHNDAVMFAMGIDDSLNDVYGTLLEKYSNKERKIREPRINSGGQCWVNSKLLADFLQINGFEGTALTKRIPPWVYELSDDLKKEFIFGLVDADGSIFTDKWNVNRYSLELNNKSLIEDVKCLLGRLNIKCSNVKERGFEGETEICGIKCNRHKAYYIYFYLDGNLKSQLQKYDLIKSDNVILSPIIKIEQVGEQETFDIQVESNNHNFVANGIVVHNSVVEGARRVWKQLSLMEDAMMIHRIMRAPEKRIFYTDIGNIPPNEVDQYMQNQKNMMKKVPYMDEQTGEYNLRFNLQNMVEDYFIAVRGGDSGTKIDTLAGMDWNGTEDIEYLRNKMMAALKIPKAFLGYEEGISGKATLASEDVRFARTIQRVQRILTSELTKIAIVHLYAQGYRDESLVEFELELTNPSTIFEKEKLEIWNDKVDVAVNMMDSKLFSKNFIYKNIFNMSDDDSTSLKNEVIEDVKQNYRIASIEEEGHDPAKPFKKIGDGSGSGGGGHAGGGGGGGGGLGGGLGDIGDMGAGGDMESPEGDDGGNPEDTEDTEDTEDMGDTEEPEGAESPEDIVKEAKLERDQSGEHKASDHPFGEDALGDKELHSNPRKHSEGKKKSEIRHNFEGGSPLHMRENKNFSYLDKELMTSLSKFDAHTKADVKKELLEENKSSGNDKSLLDETNILE
jgi:intein/homing endonuclease/uncharacterized membrane protein YgcG